MIEGKRKRGSRAWGRIGGMVVFWRCRKGDGPESEDRVGGVDNDRR